MSDVAKLINSSKGLFNVKAIITTENNFASGVMAKVTLVYDRKKNVNVLPNELVYYEAGNPYIFIVDDDNAIRKMYIEVGVENESNCEIKTNLDKKLRIVSTWNNDLAEGTVVNVIKDEEVVDDIETYESEYTNIFDASRSDITHATSSVVEEK